MGYKRLICWITRHHWLLQRELLAYGNLFIYEYQCQVCGKIMNQKVRNLDPPN